MIIQHQNFIQKNQSKCRAIHHLVQCLLKAAAATTIIIRMMAAVKKRMEETKDRNNNERRELLLFSTIPAVLFGWMTSHYIQKFVFRLIKEI